LTRPPGAHPGHFSFFHIIKDYFKRFNREKGIDPETVLKVEDEDTGTNLVPIGVLFEFIDTMPADIQKNIRDMIVKIDFQNGDILNYYRHLAKGFIESIKNQD
jgi:hypothetical protein